MQSFVLSLHYNGANNYLSVNDTEIHKFRAKDSMIVPNNLCLGNVLKDLLASKMKKIGFNGYIYDFSVDYDSIDVDDIKNIHKYLMEKNEIVQYKNVQICKLNIYFNNDVFWYFIKCKFIRMHFNKK